MIKSMTGYGRAEGEVGGKRLSVEVKAVNHRFLNFFAKLPSDLQRFESEILGLVKAHLQRGQVNVFATWDGGRSDPSSVAINLPAALRAAQVLRELLRETGLRDEVRLEHLLALPAVTSFGANALDPEEMWRQCSQIFREALADLDRLRAREGTDLAADMSGRLACVGQALDRVGELRPQVVEEYRSRLGRRVEELLQEVSVDLVAERIALEVAVFADRSDVAEEVVRLRSHLEKYDEFLRQGGVVGRKLEFLLQEMNRETNTIGSKGSSGEMSRLVVEMKSELEKIREQVQNVE